MNKFQTFASMLVFATLCSVSKAQDLPNFQTDELGTIAEQRDSENRWAVGLMQSILDEHDDTNLDVDGLWGRQSEAAYTKFRGPAGLPESYSINAEVWKKLFNGSARYVLRFDYHKSNLSKVFESTVTLTQYDGSTRKTIGSFDGSIRSQPRDIETNGRIEDGVYLLQLGFHKREDGARKPTIDDLKVKLQTGGTTMRPCLVVQKDGKVWVVDESNKRIKQSTAIHVHDSLANARTSIGCQTLPPDDFSLLIKHFIDSYPDLEDWTSHGYRGKRIGVLHIRTVE